MECSSLIPVNEWMILCKMKSVRSRDIVKIRGGVVQMSIPRLCECRIKQSGVSHPGITPVKPNLLSVIRQYLRLAQK
jgi:hypothetical protein